MGGIDNQEDEALVQHIRHHLLPQRILEVEVQELHIQEAAVAEVLEQEKQIQDQQDMLASYV